MIAVSDAWKAAHKSTLLPATYIELSYGITEPGLQEDATATASAEETFSDVQSAASPVREDARKYATLEHNIWPLNGTMRFRNPATNDVGYVTSTLSDAGAGFSVRPTITVAFSRVRTELIPGVTITWASAFGEYATSFVVTAFNGGTQVAKKSVDGNTETTSIVWLDLQNYDSITVEILGWSHPRHRARVAALYLGILAVYDKSDFMSYSHSQSVDLLSAALPKNEISFVLRNDDGRWNPENPAGAEQYLLERQEIRVRYGMDMDGDVEWIEGGRFFLSKWTTPANGITASFTARDVLEFMNETYSGAKSGTLYSIAVAAFEQANLPVLENGVARYFVDEALKNCSTTFTNDHTIAEVLQMVAHMGCCVMYQRRDGVMCLCSAPTGKSDYKISRGVSYAHPEIDISKPLKAVSADYGDSKKAVVSVGTVGEVQTISNEFVLTEADATRVAQAAANLLSGRKTMSGEYRADPRLDVLDTVEVENKYATNTVVITNIEYTTSGGAFRGKYTGRVIDA